MFGSGLGLGLAMVSERKRRNLLPSEETLPGSGGMCSGGSFTFVRALIFGSCGLRTFARELSIFGSFTFARLLTLGSSGFTFIFGSGVKFCGETRLTGGPLTGGPLSGPWGVG